MASIDARLIITYDSAVYNDAGLTNLATGPFTVRSSTSLPLGIYFATQTYTGTCDNSKTHTLYKVTFDYPSDIVNDPIDGEPHISQAQGATYR